jgi:hypothetical protein
MSLVIAVALSVVLAALPAGGTFDDDDGNVHEGSIEAIAKVGITKGCNPSGDRYCPGRSVTRGEAAAMLVRAFHYPATSVNRFTDDNGHTFESDINRLAAAGITTGCNPPKNDRFCPDKSMTRGAMAAMLTRAFNYPASSTNRFVDDNGHLFEADIQAIAAQGVTAGCNPPKNDRFCPNDVVRRDAMATFLTRALDLKPIVPEPRGRVDRPREDYPARLAACSVVVSSVSGVRSAVGSAATGSTVCVADGSYGTLTVDARRSGFVTVRSQNPLGAVFDRVVVDDASFVRFEALTVRGRVENGQDNSHHIQVLGSDVGGVFVQSPPKAWAGPGPSDWVIAFNDIADCGGFCVALVSESPSRYWPVSDMVVRGNKLGPMAGGADAIRIHNWRNLVIEDNEIFGVIENGQHNDCLQSVWGGQGLVFSGNYLHDNNCQTFFLKDGYTQDIEFTDNLSLRNRAGSAPVVGQIWPSANVVIRNNTIWDDSAFYLRSGTTSSMFTQGPVRNYDVSHNVIVQFMPYDDGESDSNRAGLFANPSIMSEDYNVFGGGWTWVPGKMGSHSVQDASPDFVRESANASQDLSTGDWRLRSAVTKGGATYNAGITWKLAGRQFGIDAYR